MAIKKVALWCLGIFILYHGARIYLVEVIRPSPREGAEVFNYSDSQGTMSIIFLPKYKIIMATMVDDIKCSQLLSQTNRGGRKVVGNFYYLEGSGLIFDYVVSPEGYEPYLYKFETLATIGENCNDLPAVGEHTRLILYRNKGQLIYYDKEFEKQEDPNLNSLWNLQKLLEDRL